MKKKSIAHLVAADQRGAQSPYQPRPQPWRPLSTDVVVEKPKCFGDLVLERAKAEGRFGSVRVGTPSEEQRYIESWYDRHPEKLSTFVATPAAVRAREQRRDAERATERKSERHVLDTPTNWNALKRRRQRASSRRSMQRLRDQRKAARLSSAQAVTNNK